MADFGSVLRGVSPYVWAGLCLAVAVVFALVAPKRQLAGTAGLRRFLLRWGHPLVWLLLALSFVWRAAGLAGLADPLAAAAGLTYVAFLGAMITRRVPPKN
jgi:hypothetical protein